MREAVVKTSHAAEITGIQYLRAVAAAGVVVDHAVRMSSFDKYFGEPIAGAAYLTRSAIGVDLFFIISGLVIVVSSAEKRTLAPRMPAGQFLLRRFIRVVPIMWIAILSYALLRWLGRGSFDIWPALRAVVLWPVGELSPLQIWTLRHEVIFYLVFALCFLGRRLARWLILVWIFSWPIAAALLPGASLHETAAQLVWTFANPINLLFGLGLAVGIGYLKWHRPHDGAPRWRFSMPLAAGGFLVAMAVALALGIGSRSLPTGLLLLPLAAAAVFCPAAPSRIGSMLGAASCSIYLFHPHFLSAGLGVWSRLLPAGTAPLAVPVLIAVTLLLCVGVYRWVEAPLIDALKRRWLRPAAPATAVSP